MKYFPAIYAKALLETLESAPKGAHEEILRRFLKVLYKNSDQRMLVKITDAAQRALLKKAGARYIEIEYANESSADLITKLKRGFAADDNVAVRLNPELIAGARISINREKELDNSFKHKLKKIFT